MTILVGYPPNLQGRSAVELGAMLARSTASDLVVCSVVPAPWLPGGAQVDAEYLADMVELADRALERARAEAPADVSVSYVRLQDRSGASGLLRAAEDCGASLIVLGSSTAGVFGHVSLSSVASRLLHSSPIPIALATRGFRCKASGRVTRITVAYGGSQRDEALVGVAQHVASQVDASLRLALLAVQARPPVTARFGVEADDVVAVWSADMRASARKALLAHAPEAVDATPMEIAVGHGSHWGEALDDIGWDAGDVLTVGSGSAGPFARVFLGSRAAKIIRDSPVPVVVVPRVRAGELAGADSA